MRYNYVMPPFGTNGVASNLSIGELANDGVPSDPGITSAIREINVLASTYPGPLPVSITGQTSISTIVGLFRQYAAGQSLYAGGTSTDYSLGSVVGAQVMSFTLTVYAETYSQYHTKKDGKITISLNAATAQRPALDWELRNTPAASQCMWLITVRGGPSVAINPYVIGAGTYTIASGLISPYSYDVSVQDLASGLSMTTKVSTVYSKPAPAPVTIQRVPFKIKTGAGAWVSDDGLTTYGAQV